MKAFRFIVPALIALICSSAPAVEVDVVGSVEAKVTSAFVWRGEIINDDWCFQPYGSLGIRDLLLSARGSWDMNSVSNASAHNRIDINLDYSHQYGRQLLRAGTVAYIYNDSMWQKREDTFEVYVGDALDVFLLPAVNVYYDFSELNGWYGTFSVGHSFCLQKDKFNNNMIELDLKAMMGAADSSYTEGVFGYEADPEAGVPAFDPAGLSLVDFTVSACLPFWRRDDLVITPGAKYMTLIDSDIRHAAERLGQDKDIFYYSLAVEYYF